MSGSMSGSVPRDDAGDNYDNPKHDRTDKPGVRKKYIKTKKYPWKPEYNLIRRKRPKFSLEPPKKLRYYETLLRCDQWVQVTVPCVDSYSTAHPAMTNQHTGGNSLNERQSITTAHGQSNVNVIIDNQYTLSPLSPSIVNFIENVESPEGQQSATQSKQTYPMVTSPMIQFDACMSPLSPNSAARIDIIIEEDNAQISPSLSTTGSVLSPQNCQRQQFGIISSPVASSLSCQMENSRLVTDAAQNRNQLHPTLNDNDGTSDNEHVHSPAFIIQNQQQPSQTIKSVNVTTMHKQSANLQPNKNIAIDPQYSWQRSGQHKMLRPFLPKPALPTLTLPVSPDPLFISLVPSFPNADF